MKEKNSQNKRASVRQARKEVVEIIPEAEKVLALSFDISSSGVQFKTKEPLKVWLKTQ